MCGAGEMTKRLQSMRGNTFAVISHITALLERAGFEESQEI
jgi:hypothetical protein